MIPASLAGKACRKASNRVQTDTFLLEHDRFERVYQCRKTRFQALQQQKDTSIESIFILSDDEPWEVFRKTNTTEGRMQRRKLVFERCRDFPVLHQACIDGDRDQVHSLLNTPGVCVLERDACGRIALHHAVIKEHFKIVKRLLRRRDAKVQTHVRDNSNRTALHYVLGKMEVLARHRKRLNIPALITTEMRVESKRYRRLWELADRMLEMFSRKELEAVGEDGESIKVLDMRCRGDVWDVCRSGDLERLEMFVKVYGCSKDEWQLSELKRTLLHEACENQQLQVVYFLIVTMDVPVLAQDTSGCTALHCAARRGYLDGCQMLLGKAANGENSQLNDSTEELVLVQDDRGRTALHWCLLGSCDPLIRLQLAVLFAQSFPAVLHICDQDGVAPLALAIWRGEIELVQEFISLGANVCASARIPQSPYGKNVEKASWAPCGIAFQRRCLRKLVKVVPRSDPTDNVPDITRSPECSKKHVINWENLQHPVEALWYWTQRSNEGNSAFNEKRIINEENKLSDSEPATTEEELGCRKYGGICRRCESFTSGYSVKTPPSPPNVSESRLCRPLLLALRMCALRLDSGSMLNDRVVIVELLLTNGASPDENCDGEYLSNHAKQVNSIDPSALSESLRSSLQYSQIIPMLRQYGADQLSIHSLMRWCVSVPSTAAKQVESVLSQLLDLENVASSSDFLTMLFHQKHFVTLCELWSNKAQNFSPSTIAAGSTDRECNWLRGISPWKCIHETLVAWSEPKKRPVELGNIDVKHLEFLCGLVHPRLDIPADKDDILHDRGAWELFDFCVDLFLRQRDNDRHSNSDFTPNHSGISLREQTLLRCIQILFKYWKHYEDADQRMKSQVSRWLEPSILRGYFDCSLVILETLHRLGGTSTLLDTVFELYSSAVGTRTSVGGEQLLHHREFLIVCAENLLKVNTSRSDEQTNLPKSTVVASARSIVHMCANNLLFPLVESCFDTVFPESTQDKSNALAAIKSVRVGRKTMVQWILVHDRYDIMRWLLKLLPPGIERGLCWSAFVAAATVNGKESITTPSSGDVLFSVYVEDVQTHLGVNERKDLVINLILRTAIPTDSVALLERLLNFWGASGPNCCDPSDAEHFGNYLKPVGVLHAIARWNAVRVAEFCLSGQCASEYQINQVNWQQIFSEENQHCHVLDGCTPLELCRLLGHYQLYKFLSSRLQTSLPEAQTDDVVENIIVESPENKDSDRSPQVGLLRSIIDINDALVAQGKAEERFTGYQRYAIIQDLWVSAVTHNQVSHLQGMSLSSHPDVSVRTLVLAAIKASSFNALKWLLEANAPITTQLSDEEGIECLYAAAKHSGDVYAKMTLLLLEHQLSPGRLSGDGMGVPLLHRAACFSNATLACRIMTLLLGRPECDVNALDAFGNTAVSYAIAVGCIHNACFLIQNSKCRLEAEYEGQSCFYYALHLVPSFAWRTIVRELLVTKRARAFLHCDADNKTCGCKGYEGEDGDLHRPCGFCGHESTSHRIVPLPSWFRDQYDTYIVAKLPRKRSHSSSDEGDDSDGDMSRQYLTDNYDTADGEDEEIVLENDRGRLDVQLLKRVTALRYDGILHANGLCGAVAVESPVDVQIAEETVTDNCNNCDLSSHPPEKESVLPKMEIDARDLQGNADPCVELYGDGIHRRGRKFTGPRWLQEELAMVHSPRCLCQSSACVTSPTQLVHIAVCRWLRRTALVRTHVTDRNVTESAIIALASVHPAFEHWRGVARLDKQSPIEAVAGPLTPLPRFLSGVMFHWRYGKEFWAFQRWKNYRTTTEVAHHRLETRLEHVAANMRRNRFITLQQRQQQLQNTAQSLKPTR